MKHLILLSAALTALLTMPESVRAGGEMRDGMWELTTAMEMPGMPMKMPPQVVKHCYSKADVKDQKKVVARDKDCVVTEFKQAGNKVTWKMKCSGKNAGTFSGDTVFSDESYVSNMKMNSKGHAMTMQVKGKRIGACP